MTVTYDPDADTYSWPLYRLIPANGQWRTIYQETITVPGAEYRALLEDLEQDDEA